MQSCELTTTTAAAAAAAAAAARATTLFRIGHRCGTGIGSTGRFRSGSGSGDPKVKVECSLHAPLDPTFSKCPNADLSVARHVHEKAIARGRVQKRNAHVKLSLHQVHTLAVAFQRHDTRTLCRVDVRTTPVLCPVALPETVQHLGCCVVVFVLVNACHVYMYV